MRFKNIVLLMLVFSFFSSLAQAPGETCYSATTLTLPTVVGNSITTGVQSTLDLADDYPAGTYCASSSYGGGYDGVYKITVANEGGYKFRYLYSGMSWKVLSIHSGCPITSANCVDGFVTSSSTGGSSGTITLTPGTYYLVVDSWPSPIGGNFDLEITFESESGDPSEICDVANGFCSDVVYDFPNTTTGTSPDGPNYGCLGSQPNPVWYYMEIQETGSMEIEIEQTTASNGEGSILDVDFALWGPYSDLSTACTQVMAGDAPIQSAYSGSNIEYVGLGTSGGSYLSNFSCVGVTSPSLAIAGQFYLLIITNYSGSSGYINFSQTSGTGSANCNTITPCNIGSITASAGECSAGSFDIIGEITFTDAPTSGSLTLTSSWGTTAVYTAPFTSPLTYTISGEIGSGSGTVAAEFSDDDFCTATSSSFIAPDCNIPDPCNISSITASAGECSSGTFDINGEITFTDAPASGTLTLTSSWGETEVYSAPFTSPLAYTISGESGSGTGTVSAEFSDDALCTATSSSFDAPSSPSISSESLDGQTSCMGGTSFNSISVSSSSGTYQWYSNITESTDGATLLIGADTDTYLPSNASAGTMYYFCVVSGCSDVTSSFSGAHVVNTNPLIDPVVNYDVCNTPYTLDLSSVTGTNLTGSLSFYDATGGPNGLGSIIADGSVFPVGTNTTVYVYDENGTCNDEVSFTIIVNSCDVTPICAGESIIQTAIGFNQSYTQYYILADSTTGEIIAYNTTGEFSSNDYDDNNFRTLSLYALNTNEASLIQTINSATLWSEIENDASNKCADILGPKYFEIIPCCELAVSSNTINESCEGENNGQLNLSISGNSTYSILIDNNSFGNNISPGDYPYSELSPNTYQMEITDDTYPNCDTSFEFIISPGETINTIDVDSTICFGDSVSINGIYYSASKPSGIQTLTSNTGCDSIVNISITVLDQKTESFTETICFGDSILVNSNYYSSDNPSGIDTLIASNGCDSILSINISFYEIGITYLYPEICFGDSILINSIYYGANNPSGLDTLTSVDGCDSIISIIVTEKPEIKTPINDTVCFGDSIDINGTYYSASNPSGTQILNSLVDGCDSTLIINIFERIQTINDDTVQVCDGGSFIYNGVTYDVSKPSGRDTTIDENGCISYIRIIELIEVDEIVNNLNIVLCYGQDTIPDPTTNTVYNADNPADTLFFTSSGGCDSIVNISITELDQETEIYNDTVCYGDSIEIYGTYYSAINPTGNYNLTGGGSNGCDLNLSINVFELSQITINLNETICYGDSINLYGSYYNSDNLIGTDTIITPNNCDTIVNINIIELDQETEIFNDTVCFGDSIEVYGSYYSAENPTGNHVLVGQGSNGCDLVLNITIFELEEITSTLNDTICFEDSLLINGNTYNYENSTGSEIFTSISGCDSTVSISLSISDIIDTTVFYSICEGESIFINGNTYDTSNLSGSDTLQSLIYGCDSIVNHQIEINETTVTLISDTICFGNSIIINGSTYDSNNLFGSDTIQSLIHGCDSIVRVSIFQTPENINTIDSTICFNDYIFINGTIYSSSNPSGIDTLTSVSGCDSIIQITVNELEDINISINDTLCYGESIVINNVTYNADNNTGVEVLISSYGCDSTINISIDEQPQIRTFINETICKNDTFYYFNNAYYYGNQFGQIILPANNGCDSTINISVNFQELPNIYAQLVVNFDTIYNLLDVDADSICDFDTIQLFGLGGENYEWSNNITDGDEIIYPFDEFYSLIGTDSNNCSNSFEFELFTDEYCIKFNLDTSNVFTPDGDGINDIFLMSGESFETNSIQIYNRWGQIIYENFDGKGWDGRLQSGEEAEPGTYFYMTTIKPITRQPSDVLSVQGYLKLIRE